MKELAYYLLQVIITSGILYSYYHFALRNKRFHRYNRFYLLAATVISITIPFLNIPVYFTQSETESSFVLQTLTVISSAGREEPVVAITNSQSYTNWLTWENLSSLFYILIASLVLLRIIFSLLKIRRIVKNNPVEQLDKIHFVNTTEPGTPFSFFRWLFWNKKIELQSEKGEQIFRHELFHIEQKHSWDIIYMELLTVLFWINPFFHLIKKEVKAIHEFLADQFAVTENKKWQYAELLLMQALNTKQQLVNPFFHNQIKRRIAMITTSQKTSYQYLRKLMVLPIAAITIALFAFSYKSEKADNMFLENDKLFTVVIDAGHGGKDAGAIAPDGTTEKDIVLAIAQKIKMLNNNENIKIVLTREDDFLPAVQSRVENIARNKADLFISLHVNTGPAPKTERSGFELVITKKNNPFELENKILANILLNYFSQIYTVNWNILQRETGIWVLDNAPCPSALIECGYLTNDKDLNYIKDFANQDKIAMSLLQAIDQFLMQSKSDDWEERKKTVADTIQPKINSAIDPVSGEKYLTIDGRKITGIIVGKEISQYGLISEGSMILLSKEQSEEIKSKYIEVINRLLVKGEIIIQNNANDKVFDKVEIEPSFPGGAAKWRQYLEKNLDASVPVKKKAPDGVYTTVIQFIVDKEGKISDVKALTNHRYGMEEEAIRVIKKGPKWEPAIQNGRVVTAYRKQPITFVIGKGNKNFPAVVMDGSSQNTNNKTPYYSIGEWDNSLLVIDGKVIGRLKENSENAGLVNSVHITVLGFKPAMKKYGEQGKYGAWEAYTLKSNAEDYKNDTAWGTGSINRVFDKTEVSPSFPGGDPAWKRYLEKNANALVPLDSGASAGVYKVVVQFIVHEDGSLSDVKALTNHGCGMEKEAMRVIKMGPNWIPAKQNGRIVHAYVQQPITFQISEDPDKPSTETQGTKTGNGSNKTPKITLAQLKSSTPLQLMQLPEGTKIVSFTFTIDDNRGGILESMDIGSKFSAKSKALMNIVKTNTYITIDNIRTMQGGIVKKDPSKAYLIKD